MIETLEIVAPHLDAAAEAQRYDVILAGDTDDIVTVDGAGTLLGSLPPDAWASVTSGFRAVVPVVLQNRGLPIPGVLVTAEDVVHGKPDPEPYLLAAARLAARPKNVSSSKMPPPALPPLRPGACARSPSPPPTNPPS